MHSLFSVNLFVYLIMNLTKASRININISYLNSLQQRSDFNKNNVLFVSLSESGSSTVKGFKTVFELALQRTIPIFQLSIVLMKRPTRFLGFDFANTSVQLCQYRYTISSIKVYNFVNKGIQFHQNRYTIWSILVFDFVNTGIPFRQYRYTILSISLLDFVNTGEVTF